MKEILKKNAYILISLATIIGFLVFWEIVARVTQLYVALPTFSSVAVAFIGLFGESSFYFTLLKTTARCVAGYLVAFVMALFLGIIAGRVKALESILAPLVAIMKAMPVVAITLILAVWTNSEVLPSIIGIMLVFPVLYTQIKTATQNVDPVLLDVMKDMGGGFAKDTFEVYIPMILPYSLAGISATFGMNVKAVVSAELLSYAKDSIGYAIYFAKANFLDEIPDLFAWTLVAVLLSVIFEYVLKLIFSIVAKKISWINVSSS